MKTRITQITVFGLLAAAGILPMTGNGVLKAQSQAELTYEERLGNLLERREAAENEIVSLQEQIETYRTRLELSRQRYDDRYRQFQELERLIALQDEKIRQMEAEQSRIRQQISLTETNIRELETELKRLIDEYKATLTYLYKHGRTTELALALTAGSINQLLVRSYYLSRFHEHQTAQTDEIRETQATLNQRIADLEQTRQSNVQILAEIQSERDDLEAREQEQQRIVNLLRQERDNLQSQLNSTLSNIENINQSLSDMNQQVVTIRQAEEERLRRLAAARQIEDPDVRETTVERLSRPVTVATPLSSTEINAIETSFAGSRGRLPWPVTGGAVSSRFGPRVDPVHRISIPHPGVDIAVPSRSQVRVVHDGYVEGIVYYNGYGDAIIVNHGKYRTLYANLSNILVSRDTVLRQGDVIGLSGDENASRGPVLFFLIREGNTNLNPETWMQSRNP